MTAKKRPGPSGGLGFDGPWRAITGYGEPGELADLTILPPPKYRAKPGEWREPAGYGVTARGRLWPDRVDLETVTVTDRDNGAVLTFALAGGGDHPSQRLCRSRDSEGPRCCTLVR